MRQGAQNVIRLKDWKRKKPQRHVALVIGVILIGVIGTLSYPQFVQPQLFTSASNAQGPGAYRVIDGDTIEAPFGVKYRLMGFDTPETYFSKCDEELELGRAATERLKQLLASG